MTEPAQFADFVRRIRLGDEQAALDLVRRYEPIIRREVRLQLDKSGLLPLFDSMDICQSVLGSFFARTAAGQFELKSPEQLVKLLVKMARNKLASAWRQQQRRRRDSRRLSLNGAGELATAVDQRPTPGELAADKELAQRLLAGLSAEERQLADFRCEGLAWGENAARLGGTPQARRMQLTRALGRVSSELGEVDQD